MHLTDILIKNPLNLQASIYLFKVNDGNTRTISSKSLKKKKTLKWRLLRLLLLTLNKLQIVWVFLLLT